MTTDALFKHIELIQGNKPWGRLLDAGTGTASLRWITSLDTLSWTAITADPQRARKVENEFSDSRREGDRVIAGNWSDPLLLQGEVFDVVLAGETGIEFSGGPLAFAVGGQFRDTRYTSDPIRQASNLDVNPCFIEGDQSCVGTTTEGVGPFIFLGGSRPVKLQQDVYAFFAEVNAPITDRLELSAAVRFEDLEDVLEKVAELGTDATGEQLTADGAVARWMAPAGLTGLWQVTQRGTGEVSPQERIALDNTYAERHGLGFDLRLILKTVPALFQSENV